MQQVSQTMADQQTAALVDRTEQQLAPYLYVDPRRGDAQGNLTEYGQKFFNAIERGRAWGIEGPVNLLQYAMEAVPPQPEAKPETKPQSQPAPASQSVQQASQQQQQSFVEEARAKAQHRPSGGAPPAEAASPGRLAAEDIRELFVTEAKKLQAAH
jgi:hypothetical protein